VDLEIVGKERDLLMLVLDVKAIQVLHELLPVDVLLEDLEVLEPILFRYGQDQGKDRLNNFGLRDPMVVVKRRVLGELDGLPGEDGLIYVDDAAGLPSQAPNFVPDLYSPILVLQLLVGLDELHLLYLLALDLVNLVDLSQQGRVYAMGAELPVEEDAAFPQGFTCPPAQSRRIYQKVDMLL